MALCEKCHRDAPDGALFCSFCGTTIKPGTAAGEAVDPLIGQTINAKYFVHQLLGRGGMGEVYKSTHLTLDRPVVLKLLKKSFLSDPSIVQRFHREARAASRLNHPNSISIIDFGQTEDGTLFMAMEYLSGRSLARVIAEDQPIPEGRVVHIGAQILAALAEAHALGIIHRDLKPENVMLESRRDEPDFVKVLDFGIAKLNEPGDGAGKLTQAGIVCGTPGYMSPEQVRGDELDPRSDLYSVGVILYEMLTAKLPFEADTPMGLVTKHLVEAVPPLGVRKPGLHVSPGLEALVLSCLAKNREERPGSAEELRASLLTWAAQGEPKGRPTPPPARTLIMDAAEAREPLARPESGGVKVWRPPTAPAAGAPPRTGPQLTQAVARTPAPRRLERTPPAMEPGGTRAMHPPQAEPTPAERRPPPPAELAVSPAERRTPSPRVSGKGAARPAPPQGPRHEMDDVVQTQDDLPPRAQRQAPRSRVILIAGASAGAALIAILVAWGLTRQPSGKAPATPAAVAAPTPAPLPAPRPESPRPAAPLVPAAVEPRPPVPEAAPPVEARSEARTESRLPRREADSPPPRESRAHAKGIRSVREELNSIPTPSAGSGDGVLSVNATPWADLWVDGAKIGETPREMRLGAGTYRLRATHPSLGAREVTITVQAGKRKVWNATFAN
jgi:eukaryotic-like serine/threonine-protein kinase